MQVLLGRQYGVWISARRLAEGLEIPARPVGVSAKVLERAGRATATYIATGQVRTGGEG
jgi:hypothetical protein